MEVVKVLLKKEKEEDYVISFDVLNIKLDREKEEEFRRMWFGGDSGVGGLMEDDITDRLVSVRADVMAAYDHR